MSKSKHETDWEGRRSLGDAAVESDPGAVPAKLVLPRRKQTVTMRLDAEILEWFRRERGYQTRINAILRAYMKAHESNPDAEHP